jgi:hypothetical protein
MTSEAVLDSSPVAGEGLDRRVFGRRAKRAGGAVSTAGSLSRSEYACCNTEFFVSRLI